MSEDPRFTLPQLSAQQVREQISPDRARTLIEAALLGGFDPATDPHRQHASVSSGALLFMPAELGEAVGVKLAAVASDNPAAGKPRVQALYMLLDAQTLSPRLLVDGTALTSLRTPAVSAAACARLADPAADRLVVFGSGPQAIEHVIAVNAIRSLTDVVLVGRNPGRTRDALDTLAASGITARQGSAEDVRAADIIVCATSAAEPLFAGDLVRPGACVLAIGSHEPGKRELEGSLVGRSLVVIEDLGAAQREAGDVIMAVDEGHLEWSQTHNLSALVRGEVSRNTEAPNVFKGTGMSWQDLAVAVGLSGA